MIIDDVEKNHQAVTVRGIDQRLKIVGRAVAAFGRERQRAVVAPVARAGKFRDRHQFDGGDAELGKARQFARDAGKAAEQAGMQLVETVSCHGRPRQSAMAPSIGLRIDDDAGAMHVAAPAPATPDREPPCRPGRT